MNSCESPRLIRRAGLDNKLWWQGADGMDWICNAELMKRFNIPRGATALWVVVSEAGEPYRTEFGWKCLHMQGCDPVLICASLYDFLRGHTRAHLEYECGPPEEKP